MKAISKFLAGGVAIAALAVAAPAAAQIFPGMGYPGYGYGGMGGYGYSPYGGYGGGYGVNSQVIANQCANAVQARLSGGYGGYGAYGGYGYSPYGYAGGARVLGISRVEPGLLGAINVHGVATSGRYGGGYGSSQIDLVWKCKADPSGAIVNISVSPAQRNYGYQYSPWSYGSSPYGGDYSQYGYVRY